MGSNSFYAGFDTSIYPGNAVMQWLWDNTNLEWTGFYLGKAPLHPDTSWMDKYPLLSSMGWGFAPVYVGRQVGRSPALNAASGKTDAAGAVQLARQAKLPSASIIYLDIEMGGLLPNNMVQYYQSWCAGVKAAKFNPGVYCSHAQSAAQLVHAFAPARVWVWNTGLYKTPSDFQDTYPALDPAAAGYPGASVLQLAQDLTIPANVETLNVDLDSSATDDPSTV